MALGNANGSSQSRGKNKPVIVKRRKEVVMAKDYNSFAAQQCKLVALAVSQIAW